MNPDDSSDKKVNKTPIGLRIVVCIVGVIFLCMGIYNFSIGMGM